MNGYSTSVGAPSNSVAGTFGAALGCGVLGMGAYYIPIRKNDFVDEAFNVAKKETKATMDVLTLSANEIAENRLSNQNKIFLNQINVLETVDAVKDKCKELHESITDSIKVKSLKSQFDQNFEMYKKSAASMDNTASKAMENLKRTRLGWGAGIGAAIGIALSLISGK